MRIRLLVLAATLGLTAFASGAVAQSPAAITNSLPPTTMLKFPFVQPDAPVTLKTLRVCADPNNLPFTNKAKQGFENKIADIVATDLGVPLEYYWWPERQAFISHTIRAGLCDVVMGMPTGTDMVSQTRPYYRSTYVFLTRKADHIHIASLDDPQLRTLKVGVHLIGDNGANTPGAMALAKRGITQNIVGFPIYGDYSKPNPPADLVKAVADGKVDVAIIWGPFAGYFAPLQTVPLAIEPVSPSFDPPDQPFVYSISMAVMRGDYALRRRLNEVLVKHKAEIDKILADYHIPLVGSDPAVADAAASDRTASSASEKPSTMPAEHASAPAGSEGASVQ